MTTLLTEDVLEERCGACGDLAHCGVTCIADNGGTCECTECECQRCLELMKAPKSAQFPFPLNTRP